MHNEECGNVLNTSGSHLCMRMGRDYGGCPIDCDENVEAFVHTPEEVTDSNKTFFLSTSDAQRD